MKLTTIKDWAICRVLSPTGARTGRGAHLLGTIEDSPDPSRIGQRIITHQLMDIDLQQGRVGTHYQDFYLLGDGRESWVTIDYIRTLQKDLSPP